MRLSGALVRSRRREDVVRVERVLVPEEEQGLGKAALTELFENTKTPDTPVIVERIVADIDAIVEKVRFPGWQHTDEGERTVKQAVRRTLLAYKFLSGRRRKYAANV